MLDWQQAAVFALILARMSAFMLVSPIFSLAGVPALAKVGLAAMVAILLLPAQAGFDAGGMSVFAFGLLAAGEVMVGLALGLVTTMVFRAIEMAGSLLDLEMGFAMGTIFDPLMGSQVTLLGRFFNIIGLLLLLTLDYHHTLLRGLAASYQLLPLGGIRFSGEAVAQVVEIFAGSFALALRLAAPVTAVLVISDLALGLVARTVPQLNVFILGFPIKVGVGTLILALAMPLFMTGMAGILETMGRDLALVMGVR